MDHLCDICGKETVKDFAILTLFDKSAHLIYFLCNDLKCRQSLLKKLGDETEREIEMRDIKEVERERENKFGLRRLAPNILAHPSNVCTILSTGETVIEKKKKK